MLRQTVRDPVQADTMLLCAGEAMANAIEHGSDGNPDRSVTIEAFAEPDKITITVADTGGWAKDPTSTADSGRGHGLTIIHGLAEHVQTARTPQGTRQTVSWSRAPATAPRQPARQH